MKKNRYENAEITFEENGSITVKQPGATFSWSFKNMQEFEIHKIEWGIRDNVKMYNQNVDGLPYDLARRLSVIQEGNLRVMPNLLSRMIYFGEYEDVPVVGMVATAEGAICVIVHEDGHFYLRELYTEKVDGTPMPRLTENTYYRESVDVMLTNMAYINEHYNNKTKWDTESHRDLVSYYTNCLRSRGLHVCNFAVDSEEA